MKQRIILNEIPHPIAGPQTDSTEPAAIPQIEPPFTFVERALTAAQQRLTEAQQQIAGLEHSNRQMREQMTLLSRLEAKAHHDAYHDDLTGLPNRRLLLDRLRQAIAQSVRQRRQVMLLLLDIDDFKTINDHFGHAGGDDLLRAVAKRLTASIRGADTACRYGGDEFVIMLPEINGDENSASVERKIRERLAAPYTVGSADVKMTVSIGTAVFPVHAKNLAELMNHADIAMYRAKGRPNNTQMPEVGGSPRNGTKISRANEA